MLIRCAQAWTSSFIPFRDGGLLNGGSAGFTCGYWSPVRGGLRLRRLHASCGHEPYARDRFHLVHHFRDGMEAVPTDCSVNSRFEVQRSTFDVQIQGKTMRLMIRQHRTVVWRMLTLAWAAAATGIIGAHGAPARRAALSPPAGPGVAEEESFAGGRLLVCATETGAPKLSSEGGFKPAARHRRSGDTILRHGTQLRAATGDCAVLPV